MAQAHGGAEETAYGKPGDGAGALRIVQVVMREEGGRMLFQPDRLTVRVGEQVRFLVRNNGKIEHEFVVATLEDNLRHLKAMEANPDMRHEEPNARRLDPKQTAEILWRFTKPGTFDFSCLIPGHREAGMFGTILVE
ncbi:cupredoxin family protein [Reyranella sp.]|uniref:cupredoxin domain-containing protein n=1 Tax=Reyranella sp. TaxID=1929291 RepID=UPI0026331DA2|nr:cupredoxin family protein [Reyranella sp.]HQS15343.1 cupredoxin family protein [Reyranella sp.]HQT11869.1 cupredoxin family protein [Reyranella sp.]